MKYSPRVSGVTKTVSASVCLGLLLGLSATSVQAQKKPAPAAKPPVKGVNKPGGTIVLGTTQLAGDFGKIGTTYTVGKSAPINFTLQRAEYSIAPLVIGGNVWVPNARQKLLLLHYTAHNPLPREQGLSWSSFRFTVVDAEDKNQDAITAAARTGTNQPLSVQLKPAQKVDVTVAVLVPAQGVVPKLIVQREKDAPVIRYDLRGKVSPLPTDIADPADTEGATVRREIVVKPGVVCQTGVFDTRLDAVGSETGSLIGRKPENGSRFVTGTFTIKNRTNQDQSFYWGHFHAELVDADGEKAEYTEAILKATRDEKTDGKLAPGEEARIRFFFSVPENVAPKSLRLTELKEVQRGDGRAFAFDMSGSK